MLQIVQEFTETEAIDFPTFLDIFGFSNETNTETSNQDLFSEFTNGGQTFDSENFKSICERVGEHFSPAEVEAMVQAADANNDGVIDYQEFLDVVTKEHKK